jgi:hypothetical protein
MAAMTAITRDNGDLPMKRAGQMTSPFHLERLFIFELHRARPGRLGCADCLLGADEDCCSVELRQRKAVE